MKYIGTQMCNMSANEIYDIIHKKGRRVIKKLERIFGDGYSYEMIISYTLKDYESHVYKLMVDTIDDWLNAHFTDIRPSIVLLIRINVINEFAAIRFEIDKSGKLQFVYLKNQNFYTLDTNEWTTPEEIMKRHSMKLLMDKL